MQGWISTFQACTAEHHIEVMGTHVVPDTLPEQLDDRLDPVGLEHAGPSEFEKAKLAVKGQQWRDIEFASGIESALPFGDCLPQQAVCSNQFTFSERDWIGSGGAAGPDDHEMVTNVIKAIKTGLPPGN